MTIQHNSTNSISSIVVLNFPLSTPMQPIYSVLSTDEDLRELVIMFVDEMPERIAKIESEFATSNWEELRRTAHQLKGAAGSYGFTKLSSVAAEVENLLKNKASLEETEQKVQYLITLCRCATSDPPPEESSK